MGDWIEAGASYYHLGGQRVARRAGANVTYLHGDHLGSVGKTSGYTATAQLYDAYGAKRGSSEVDAPYRYTGQRWEENDALDIYTYKARWYDPALGRFLQPDTIVPSAANPQSLNRYAYCLNNPVRYSDPTGHWAAQETTVGPKDQVVWVRGLGAVGVVYDSPGGASVMRQALKVKVEDYAERVDAHLKATQAQTAPPPDSMTAAEANIAIVRQGVDFSRNDADVFMETVGRVFADYDIDFAEDVWRNVRPSSAKGAGEQGQDQVNIPGSQGFKTEYQDPHGVDLPQTVHFWYYVRYAYESGYLGAMIANAGHEFAPGQAGSSWQDYWLGEEGAYLGALLGDFEKYGVRPSDVEQWMRENIYQ